MRLEQLLQQRGLRIGGDAAHLHDLRIDAGSDPVIVIEQEGHTTGHAGTDVASGAAKHHHNATGHVLTAVISGTLHDRTGTTVADTKALTGTTMGKQFATGRSVQTGVAENHLIARVGSGISGHQGDPAAVHALADVIIRLTLEPNIHPLHQEGTEALPGSATEGQIELSVETTVAMALGDFTSQSGADTAVGVDDLHTAAERAMALHRSHQLRIRQQLILKDRAIAMGLGTVAKPGAILSTMDRSEQAGQVHTLGLGQLDRSGLEQIGASNQIFKAAHTQQAHQLTNFLSHVPEEVDDMLGDAGETFAQVLLLRGHTDRAVVGVANTGHHAAFGDHGDRTEAVLLRTKERSDHHVPAGFEATIGPQQHPFSQTVLQQSAMHLGQAQLPGAARMLDRAER